MNNFKKHKYVLKINKGASRFSNEFKYGNQLSKIAINNLGVAIIFDSDVEYTQEQFVENSIRIVVEGLTKAYLLYCLKYGRSLNVTKIVFSIDGKEREYSKEYSNFPFVYSMINFKNDEIKQLYNFYLIKILNSNKNKRDNKNIFITLYAILSAFSEKYEINKFQKLWTALNSIYNFVARKFDEKANIIGKKCLISNVDSREQCLFEYVLGEPFKLISKNENKEFWNNNKNFEQKLCFYIKTGISFEKLCDALNNIVDSKDEIGLLGTSPKMFLIICYPYYLRCQMIHGSKSIPLIIKYNSDDFAILKFLNNLLTKFLFKILPLMENFEFSDSEIEYFLNSTGIQR